MFVTVIVTFVLSLLGEDGGMRMREDDSCARSNPRWALSKSLLNLSKNPKQSKQSRFFTNQLYFNINTLKLWLFLFLFVS